MPRPSPCHRGWASMWKTLRAFYQDDRHITVDAIARATRDSAFCVRDYFARLARAGMLIADGTSVTRKGNRTTRYAFVSHPPVEPPSLRRDGSAAQKDNVHERLWRSLRILKRFTIADLQIAASLPDAPAKFQSVKRFITHLNAAGYLAVLDPGHPGKLRSYRLKPSMNTGPLPPMIKRGGLVIDRNIKGGTSE